jgi:hypothetical protein
MASLNLTNRAEVLLIVKKEGSEDITGFQAQKKTLKSVLIR